MYAPAFTTHGVSMNQRLLDLGLEDVITENAFLGIHTITAVSPPSGRVAPPGYYMLFVVHQGVPSVSSILGADQVKLQLTPSVIKCPNFGLVDELDFVQSFS